MRTKGIAEVGIKIITDTMMNIRIREGGGVREGIEGEDTIIKDQETGDLDLMIDIKMLKRKILIKMTIIRREMEETIRERKTLLVQVYLPRILPAIVVLLRVAPSSLIPLTIVHKEIDLLHLSLNPLNIK